MYTIGLLTLSSSLALIVAAQLKALQAQRRAAGITLAADQ
jgi:hypothetical protein